MVFDFGKGNVAVFGGPYRQAPEDMPGVKMAAEIDAPCAVDIPTRDFDVPQRDDMVDGLMLTLWLLRKHRKIYVGCMGGIGRTGLFLAVLTRLLTDCDGPEAVRRVRAEYKGHAVETQEQQEWVAEFRIPWYLKVARFLVQIGG
jgi:hypothetical protein